MSRAGTCRELPGSARHRSACACRTRRAALSIWAWRSFLLPFALLSLRRRGRVGHILGDDEDPALVELGGRIAGFLLPQDFVGVRFRVVLRPVAEAQGVGIVVPAALVAGHAVHDL